MGVRVSFEIYSIEPISGESMNLKLGMYLKMRWNDPRLRFSALGHKIVQIENPSDLLSKIWIPDVFISNNER